MNTLGLNKTSALKCINAIGKNLHGFPHHGLSVSLENDILVGDGHVNNFEGDMSVIRVGVADLAGRHSFPISKVDDLSFTRAVVALHHEYGHYLQDLGPRKDIECMVSEVSVIGNIRYYMDNWKQLPYEIKAEATGVSMSWDAMSEVFPSHADDCMLEYINFCTKDTSYMLPEKDGGYKFRDEVVDGFEAAMYQSLNMPQIPNANFLRSRDESIRLVVQDCKNFRLSPNFYHADKLIDTMPGQKKDRMMASLVLQLHPDIFDERPELRREKLSVEQVFGKPLAAPSLPGSSGMSGKRRQSIANLSAKVDEMLKKDSRDRDYGD